MTARKTPSGPPIRRRASAGVALASAAARTRTVIPTRDLDMDIAIVSELARALPCSVPPRSALARAYAEMDRKFHAKAPAVRRLRRIAAPNQPVPRGRQRADRRRLGRLRRLALPPDRFELRLLPVVQDRVDVVERFAH